MLQVRGHVRHVQGAEPVPGARDAQHLPRLPHLRVHGQPPAVRRRDCVTVTQQRTSCFPPLLREKQTLIPPMFTLEARS